MMKKYIKYMASLLAVSFAMSACIDLEEMNVDPNNATTTNPSLLLTGVAYSAFNQTSSDACHAAKMLILTSGESKYQVYKWTRGDFDYYSNLRDVTKMSEEAGEGSAYQALAHFFRANYFYQLTLDFGSIPYTDALKAETDANYQPAYDSQEVVLAGILKELEEVDKKIKSRYTKKLKEDPRVIQAAESKRSGKTVEYSRVVKELEEADKMLEGSDEIISGDIIYNGNLVNWRKLINAYRLRILMSLSGKEKVGDIDVKSEFSKIVADGPLMESLSDNGQLIYLDQQDNRYPYFNDSDFGSGRFMDSTYIAALATRQDPRLFAVATQTPNAEKAGKAINDFSSYDGGDPAVPYSLVNDKAVAGNCSKPAPRYYQTPTNEPMVLLGYVEQQLILAEAVVRGWIQGDDKIYYESAVKASFEFYQKYAVSVADYLTQDAAAEYLRNDKVAYSSSLSTDEKIERIIMQKYLPTFLQGSVWLPYYEALRTGYPDFRRAAGVSLPYRWMYPQDEYNNNATHVEAALNEQFGGSDKTSDKPWWLQ